MGVTEAGTRLPFAFFKGTAAWAVLDLALKELIEEGALVEKDDHGYIVGFLSRAIIADQIERAEPIPVEERVAALQKVREAVRKANPENRDLVEEQIQERRREAERE